MFLPYCQVFSCILNYLFHGLDRLNTSTGVGSLLLWLICRDSYYSIVIFDVQAAFRIWSYGHLVYQVVFVHNTLKRQNTLCLIGASSIYKLMCSWECLCGTADPGIEEWKGRSGLHMCSRGFNCYWCSGWFICSWRNTACINYWSCYVAFGLVRLIQCSIYGSEVYINSGSMPSTCRQLVEFIGKFIGLHYMFWLVDTWNTVGTYFSLHIICIQCWISYQILV